MKKSIFKTFLGLTLILSTIGILSSCVTFQDMKKPNKEQRHQKKKHPNAMRVEYKIKTPNHTKKHGKGHKN